MAEQKPSVRPALTADTRVEDFRQFYWLKQELADFCRQHGISASGGKLDLARRIELFLTSGQIETAPAKRTRAARAEAAPETLTLETVIHAGFVCTQRHRAFFKSVIGPKFHFSTALQRFFAENVGKTYQDAVDAWHAEQAQKRQPDHQTRIAPQFEYNQFIRDFFSDAQNHGKTRQDAIDAWKRKRSQPGDNRYTPADAQADTEAV